MRFALPFPLLWLCLWLPNLHAPDETVLDQINMLDYLIHHDVSVPVTDDLTNVYHRSSVLVGFKAQRFDVWIDQAPLARPVVANATVAVDTSTLHPIRPVNVDVHGGQSRVDIAGVERIVGIFEKTTLSNHFYAPVSE